MGSAQGRDDEVVVLPLVAPLASTAVDALQAQAAAALARGARLRCTVDGPVDLTVLDALARLCLLSRRAAAPLLVHGTGELPGLLGLVGLELQPGGDEPGVGPSAVGVAVAPADDVRQ